MDEDNQEVDVERKKRRHSVLRRIGDLKESDYRVCVLGTVVSVDEPSGVFVIDDSKNQLTIISASPERLDLVKPGRVLRVFGTIMPSDGVIELKGEIIQDFTGINIPKYNELFL